MYDDQETSTTENSMETHEMLFTTESELDVINNGLRKGKNERNYRLQQTMKLGPMEQFEKKQMLVPNLAGYQFIICLGICQMAYNERTSNDDILSYN